jgi:hypothetical protein
MTWFPVEGGYINLEQAVKIVNDGSVVTVAFARGETERISAEKWDFILEVIKPPKPPA